MKSFVFHIEIKVSDKDKSFPFYKDLLKYLGYEIFYEDNIILGATNKTCDLWICKTQDKYKKNKFHRKNTGLNHICFGVSKQEDVDKFIQEFLSPRGIKPLYNSPKEYPEYAKGYYAVYFEDPDRIKLEVTYIPGFEKVVAK